MFNKKNGLQEQMEQAENKAITSIIDETMSIEGEITFSEKTKIDGKISGNIRGEHLILSDKGTITGDVVATSFNCFGTLKGNIKANILVARKGCSIQGRLEATSLTVEPGASIDGEIKAALSSNETVSTKTGSGDKTTMEKKDPAA